MGERMCKWEGECVTGRVRETKSVKGETHTRTYVQRYGQANTQKYKSTKIQGIEIAKY